MRRFTLAVAVVLCVTPAVVSLQQPQPAAARPNVVLIMTDDMGYADLASYGGKDIRTPNIDSIGRDGVRMTDAYANGVLCSPTRAALISGRYPQRFAIENALGNEGTFGLTVTGNSMPLLLKNSGYATALIGKWHLGGTVTGDNRVGGPRVHGFEYFFGLMGSHIDYWHHNRGPEVPDLWENETRITLDGQYMTDLITDRSVKFIEQSAAAGRPFFVDVAYNAPHWPYQRPDRPSPAPGTGTHQLPQQENTPTRDDLRAMLENVDQGVGRILQTIQRLGLTRNTIVIFTNDNGGEWLMNNGPLFNRKWTVWEGGIRVPAMVKWPAQIPAGRVSDQVAVTFDWSASILAAAGVAVPATYDGINLFPILEGRQQAVERTLYWRAVPGNRNMRGMRSGDWKLVVDANHVLVFNIRQDIGERNDLTNQRQDIARRLRPMLAQWEEDVNKEAMTNEPDAAARLRQQEGGGRAGGAAPAAPAGGRGGRGATP
jgi:arylsulfatase A-like enzyme